MREEPPVADGTWDTCVVQTLDYHTVLKVYQWLQLGRHQFKSLIIDSISELQVKLIDQVAGSDQLKMQHWGELLRALGSLLRDLRDLTMHPTNPLEAVILTSMQREGTDGKMKPYLQGQIQVVAPYLFDILGYIRIEQYPNPDPSLPPYRIRRLYVESTEFAEAGERVQGRLGAIVEQQDLSVEVMLDRIYGPRTPTSTTTPATAPAAGY